MKQLPNTLVIPVETLNREFDAKLLLALMAAERGLTPIFGSRTRLHDRLSELPRSIYLSKGIRSGSRVLSSLLERLGHIMVALDEEALVRYPDDAFLMKLDAETFNRARLLYAWGPDNARVWRLFKGYRGTPILETGNPRFDLLRPDLRAFHDAAAAGLRARFGEFVLLSSNFAFVNHFIPNQTRFTVAKDAPREQAEQVKSGLEIHKRQVFTQFLAAIPPLAKAVAPKRLVIRPHPSESHAAWIEAAAGHDNVAVLHEGPIAPWLMAASGLIHNSCTSSVEAALLGTPSIAFMPVMSEHDLKLPNSLSPHAASASQLATMLQDLPQRRDGPTPTQRAILDHHVAAIGGATACERILTSLDTHRDALLSGPEPGLMDRFSGLFDHHKRNAIRFVKTRRKLSRSSGAYTRHKFPGIALAEVETRANRFRQITGRFATLAIRERRPDIFTIERG